MPWNIFNTLKTPAKKAGGEILTFDSMTGVTLHTGTPGWKVYTIRNVSSRTITANVLTDTSINIVVCGGGGGVVPFQNQGCGGGGGGKFREVQKRILASNPGQTFVCSPSPSGAGVAGGTSSIIFSDPNIGDISCGGGGKGTTFGGSNSNAPTNGGSGGGGGGSTYGTYPGGFGVYNGGSGYYNSTLSWCANGGGGGAGGPGGSSSGAFAHGSGGSGVSTNLDGIKLVYNSTYKFCNGGGGGGSFVDTIGSGSGGITADYGAGGGVGASGAIIIAIPA